MEGGDEVQQLGRTPNLIQEREEAHKVEHLGQVNECNVKGLPLLSALLLQLSQREDHVDCGSLCSEPTLGFRVDTLGQCL